MPQLGDKFPVTVQPLQYVQVQTKSHVISFAVTLILSQLPSQQREVTVAHGDEAILYRMKDEEEESFRKQLIGELLPQQEARERMIRLRVTVCGIS